MQANYKIAKASGWANPPPERRLNQGCYTNCQHFLKRRKPGTMGPQHENDTTNDKGPDQIRPRCALDSLASEWPDRSVSVDEQRKHNRVECQEREALCENQIVRQSRRRRDTAMHTLLVLSAMASAVCLSAPRSPSVFVDSFSFKLFHRSGARQHKITTETPTQILSASAQDDIDMMNSSFENIKKKNAKTKTPSLAEWKVDMDEKRITGRSMNHPFVPDGELITTSCLDPSCMDGEFKAGDIISTIQGTKYELMKGPPVGSSYFATPESTTDQVFKEDIFSSSMTDLPLDQQLAFLEEMTNMVKAKQAAEMGTSPPVSSSTSVSTPQETSVSPPPATPSSSEPLAATEIEEELPSSINQPELTQQAQQEESETPPKRPTFSVNKSVENTEREREIKKETAASKKDKVEDSDGNVLGSVATVTAAVAASAAVTLGGQTGIGNDLLDEAKRQAETQMSPQTKEVLASINTQVQETSKVVLPYLEEQIRIAEAKVEEAHLEEKAKSAWNEVSNYLNNEQSRPPVPTTSVTASTSAETTQSIDSVKNIATPSDGIVESISTPVDSQAMPIADPPKVESETTAVAQSESSAINELVQESSSTPKTIEEVAPTTPTETVTGDARTGGAVQEQTSQQVEAAQEVPLETLQASANDKGNAENEANQLQAIEKDKADSEALQARVEAEAEVLQTQAMEEEKQLSEAARIVEEQLEAARREVARLEAARREVEGTPARSSEILSSEKSPLAADTEAAKVEVVGESEAIGKSPSSVVETFGGNFVVAQEESKLGNAAVSSAVPDPSSIDAGESNVEKPTTEMMKNAITVEVETATELKESLKEATTELAESVLAGSSVVQNELTTPTTVESSQSIVEKIADVLEKGKKTTQAIGDAGREAIDTGKRTYEAAVDTGRRVVDTGKRTAKAIEETGQLVGTKGKEAYEAGQKYAKIGKEILQDEEKVKTIATGTAFVGVAAAYASNAFSIEKLKTGFSSDEIENDDVRSNSISMDPAIEPLTKSESNAENVTNEISTVTPSLEEDLDGSEPVIQNKMEPNVSEEAIPNEVVSEPAEEESENVIEPEMLSSMPPPKPESPYRIEVRTNDVIDTTSTIKTDSKKEGAPSVSSTEQAPPGKQVGFGVPSSKNPFLGKKAPSPFGGPPKQKTPVKKVGFGVPSSNGSTIEKKVASPFKSPPKTSVTGKQVGFGVPSSEKSAFAKKGPAPFKSPPSPFGAPSKQESPVKDEESGLPSSKSSEFSDRKDSRSSSPSKQRNPDQKVEFGVPPSKRTAFGKKAVSSFDSFPTQKSAGTSEKTTPTFDSFPKQNPTGKQEGSEVVSSKSNAFPKKVASPFKSPPSPFKTPPTPFKPPPSAFKFPPKQEGPGKKVGFGVPPSSKKNPFGNKVPTPFGVPPKQASTSKKEGFGIASPKSNDFTKKEESTSGSDKKVGSKVESSLSVEDKEKEVPSIGSSPKSTVSDEVEPRDSSKITSDSNTDELSDKSPSEDKSVPKKSGPPFGSVPKEATPSKKVGFGVPPPKGTPFGKAPSPFGSPPKKFAIPTPPSKASLTEKNDGAENAKKNEEIATSDDVKDGKKFEKSGETDKKQTDLPKFGMPSRTIPSTNSESVKESVGDRSSITEPSKTTGGDTANGASPGGGPTKFPVASKSTIPTSSFDGPPKKDDMASVKKTTPFGKGATKFPVPPKSTIPSSSFDGPSKKENAESDKETTPFGKGTTKFPVPPKSSIPSSSFDGPPKKNSAPSTKKATPFGKSATKFPAPPKSKIPTSSFDGSPKKDVVASEKKTIPFGKGATKFPVPPKSTIPSSSFDGPPKKDSPTSAKKGTPFGKGPTKFPGSPKSTITSSSFDGPPKKDSVSSAKKGTPFGKSPAKFPGSPKSTIPSSSFDGPPKKDSVSSAKKGTPFGKSATKFPAPPKSNIPTSSFDGPPKKDSVSSVKKGTPFGKSATKFPAPPKSNIPTSSFDGPPKKESVSSVKKGTPFGKGPAKFPASTKSAIPTSSFDGRPKKDSPTSAKKGTPFGKGATKFQVPPKSKIPSSSFDGPLKKDTTGSESAKKGTPFGKGATKFPVPPKSTKFPVSPKSTIPTSSFDGPTKKDSSSSVKKTSPFGKGATKFPVPPKSTIPTSSFDEPVKKDGPDSAKKVTPFGKGPAKFPVPPKSTIPTSSFDGPPKKDGANSAKKVTPFGKGPGKFPAPNKSTKPTSSFDGPSKKSAESGKTSTTFGGQTKSLFPKNGATGQTSNFGSASDEFLPNKTSNMPSKDVDRSYFTDTSRNGYDEVTPSRPDNTASKFSDVGSNGDEQFPIEETSAQETSSPSNSSPAEFSPPPRSSIDDDEEESMYLTEENQKRFFPEPGSTQVELGYRVGAPPEENQGDTSRGSTYLTGKSDGIPSPKKRVVSPRDDSRPRITPYDESVYTGNDEEEYGKTPEELMEEVMRIAREQEARNNGDFDFEF